ncbi:MAG: glycosyltransferase [candidate division Zixibacteria bacterium]|nr:glycosyltransferase [candidate division Zixibacteria bacterium]MBU1472131.1 glycosyltransferase [candidate division Zixibacteria bacterium]
MKILVIAPRPPYPLYGGYEVRVYPLFKALSKRHDISLMSKSFSEHDQQSIAGLREVFSSVELFPVLRQDAEQRSRTSILRRIADVWFPPVEYHDRTSFSVDMLESFERKVRNKEFDILHVLGLNILRYVPGLENLPAVCDAVDDYSLFCYRTMVHQKSLAGKLSFFLEWVATRRFERRFVPKFKEVVLVSPVDAAVMRKLSPTTRISVIPNGVDAEHFRSRNEAPRRPVLIFTGVMDYEPNVTGVLNFAKSILPLIEEKVPDVEFWIVGRDPEPQVLELAKSRKNVKVTGFVEDMREYFDRAMIYVSPLISGAGIKNKILEAWSMEKAVVATSMSCDGIDVVDGEDIIVADSPTDFANSVIRLIKNGDLRTRLGANARKKVIDRYSWESQAAQFEELYRRVLQSGHQTGSP